MACQTSADATTKPHVLVADSIARVLASATLALAASSAASAGSAAEAKGRTRPFEVGREFAQRRENAVFVRPDDIWRLAEVL